MARVIRPKAQQSPAALRPGGRPIVFGRAEQARMVNAIWVWNYRCSSVFMGGCRPVSVAVMLEQNGCKVSRREVISQGGFRSGPIVAHFVAEGM